MTNQTPSQVYYVRSDTDPTHFYAVNTDARGLLRCECKSAQYRRTPCKHQRQVCEGKVRPATPKAQPVPALCSQSQIDELYGEPDPWVCRGRDLVMGGLREPVA